MRIGITIGLDGRLGQLIAADAGRRPNMIKSMADVGRSPYLIISMTEYVQRIRLEMTQNV